MTVYDGNRNLVAALSYFLGFVTGIVILLVEKDDKFIRFHALQSTITFGGLFIINIIIGIIFAPLGIFEILGRFIDIILFMIGVIIWIVSMFRAYSGEIFKWPISGKLAETWISK